MCMGRGTDDLVKRCVKTAPVQSLPHGKLPCMDLEGIDVDWVRMELESFVWNSELIPMIDMPGIETTRRSEDDLVRQTVKVAEILTRLLPDSLRWVKNAHQFQGWRKACLLTLAALDSREEITRALPPQDKSPRLAASGLHAQIWDPASTLWSSGHFAEAVRAAAVSVNAALQKLADRRDVSDLALANEFLAPGEPSPERPRLRVVQGGMSDETTASMQRGIHAQGQAIFSWLRNPPSHELIELEEQEALEMLATMSAFMRAVDRCEVAVAT